MLSPFSQYILQFLFGFVNKKHIFFDKIAFVSVYGIVFVDFSENL
jgi:hypothetical protein